MLLLDTGTTVVRNTAAEQLALVQKSHPHELYNLLGRVVPYLKYNQWETRVAAAKAIGGIVENVSRFEPNLQDVDDAHENVTSEVEEDASVANEEDAHEPGQLKSEEELGSYTTATESSTNGTKANLNIDTYAAQEIDHEKLRFETFDIIGVIKHGETLLGSAGKEYDWNSAGMSAEERLARAKHDVTARLGLGAEYMDRDFLSEQDLSTPNTTRVSPYSSGVNTPTLGMLPPRQQGIHSVAGLPSPSTPIGDEALSARQKNMLKRKAKMGNKFAPSKVRVIDVSTSAAGRRASQDESVRSAPSPLRQASSNADYFSITPQAQNASKIVVEHKVAPASPASLLQAIAEGNGWSFDGLVELLIVDLFDPKWEIRHGAALALREVLRVQAPGAGKRLGKTLKQNTVSNKLYLDDLACRFCCIFALDRFGDYVSDQVVAPIRESISQTLAALLKHLPESSVKSTFDVLTSLIFQTDLPTKAWEVTHGGMLGMKYLVAVRKDILLLPEVLDGVISAVLQGLADHDDDVRAVSAATLVPIADEFVQDRPEAVSRLLDVLWDCLADLRDDLSASTGSVMDLLAKLCSNSSVLGVMQAQSTKSPEHSFARLIPRLYPFLRHTITSVRRAVLRALQTLLRADSESSQAWVDSRFLRLIFQILLVEQNDEVLQTAQELWSDCLNASTALDDTHLYNIFSGSLSACAALTMTPIGYGRNFIALDVSLLIRPSGQSFTAPQNRHPENRVDALPKSGRRRKEEKKDDTKLVHNVDSPMLSGDVELVGIDVVLRTRVAAATALGRMLGSWSVHLAEPIIHKLVNKYSVSQASSPHFLVAILTQEYASAREDAQSEVHEPLRSTLETLLSLPAVETYSNLTPLLRVVRSQCQALCTAFLETGRVSSAKVPSLAVICKGEPDAGPTAFDLPMADKLIQESYDRLCSAFKSSIPKTVADARQSVVEAIAIAKDCKLAEDVRVYASIGAAFVAFGKLPKRLNPIIKALMDSIKKEESLFMQRRSATALATLVSHCATAGRGPAADKLIKNLCAFLCVDTTETPEFHRNLSMTDAIYSLRKLEDMSDPEDTDYLYEAREARKKHAGAQMALEEMATRFKGDLFSIIPKLSRCIFDPIQTVFGTEVLVTNLQDTSNSLGQEVIDGLSILRTLVPKLDDLLFTQVFDTIPLIFRALQSNYASIRHTAASCFAQICKVKPTRGMQIAVTTLVPFLADAGHSRKRQGAMEAINLLVSCLDVDILPYVIFLIVPVLGRMSDSDNDIRTLATTTFAMLVKLVPLEAGIPDPPGFSKEMLQGRDNERKFIQQMLDGSKVESFEIPVAIKADLRSYQQDGVNWLAFLNRYQLHGILCDDMGLGKTLQTICIVASDHHNRRLKYTETKLDEFRPLPSIVICPPSLSGHWQHELQTYAPFLNCVCYVGYPPERRLYRPKLDDADVIVTSYDIARNDVDLLSKKNFNYCVLDEGHIIKNAKAKLTQSVKMLKANHRLILSGTPIQNNVLELWSLFDFLMPGFLGTEKTFHDRYSKPIANSRDSKSSSKEQEAGALALEALHKQVLPFLLRRLKEDVLADLPPKIIQDYYCDLSPLQKSLYNDFASSQAPLVAQETEGEIKKEAKSHVFQALQYMRKLCNHPALVMNEKHPKYDATVKTLSKQSETLRDIQHGPKLLALKDLLLDCGIGTTALESNSGANATLDLGSSVVNQHRALIFCQIKDMLDMVEHDVLKKLLPTVSYMRLDGTTDPRKRQSIVQQFNADPSIDVLLLTTHVGGLGLNLTGADTVIFVEHDWNPMKDLQAMDRAHRIGQKKTVNVYRLITRGTLEEKIMGLQRFKINIASTIVNQQNSGLATMETDQILDLFNVGDSKENSSAPKHEGGIDAEGNIIKKGQKSVFDDLEALHDETEYAFDVDSFVKTL